MNKWKLAFITAVSSAALTSSVLAAPQLHLWINSVPFISEHLELKVENGKVWAPVDRLAESFQGKATYDAQKNEVRITLPEAANQAQQIHSLETSLSPDSAREALDIWAKGIRNRSGALQYAVFSPDLRAKTKKQFDDIFWVTGGSSPHMGTLKNMKAKALNNKTTVFTFDYELIAQNKNIGTGKAVVTVQKMNTDRGEGWFITNIKLKNPMDTGITIGVEKL
jgi:hypothetical protein